MEFGRKVFECLGNKAAVFFDFARQGSLFVYGTAIVDVMKVFAFTVN